MDKPLDASSIRDYFGYDSKWLSTRNNEKIHYLDEGDPNGKVVLLVHGSAIGITAAANFYLTIPELVKAGYRVIAPDLYGYGWTENGQDIEPTRENHVDQLLRILDALRIDQKVYLIGNSLGGMIAAALTLHHPQRVEGLLVIGTAGALWQYGARRAPKTTSSSEWTPYERSMVKKAMLHLVDNPEFVPDELLAFREKMAEREGAYERHVQSTWYREDSKKRLPFDAKAAGECEVPALFIYGMKDRVNPPEDALAGAEAFKHADIMFFAHCGHWTMIERADDFNDLMLKFLSGYNTRIASPQNHSAKIKK